MIKRFFSDSRQQLVWSVVLACLFVAGTAQGQRQVLDRVIAIVDDGVILQSEYEAREAEMIQRIQEMGAQMPPPEQLREQVMENLIVENLQLQMAERVGIRFDDDTLNRVLTDIAQSNGMSFDQYVNALDSQGMYQETRERIRKEMSINEVQRGMVNRRISITDQEIENYLNSEAGRSAIAPDYMVEQIMIPANDNVIESVREARLELAESVADRANNGESFAALRQELQQQGIAVSGGELGWRKADALPTLFASVVPDMRIGETHEPLQSSNGYHVIRLNNVRGDEGRLVPQTEARHILIAPNEIRTEEQARRLINELHQRIVDGEDFNVLARQYSDDNMTVVGGGDMGWVNDNGFPPEFGERISTLPVGELSEPFRTSFGWHIAEVTGRREQDLSRQYRRQQAENALRNRKFQLELENWMLELRDEAYVKYIN